MTERNPYTVLDVARDASAEKIHDAYRHLAKRWHPDLNPGDPTAEAHFKEIGAAYEILSHADRRAAFDRDNARAADEGENRYPRQPSWSDDGLAPTADAAEPAMSYYVEELRELRRQNQRKPNPALFVLAAYVALTFINGMLLGFTTELNGVVVASKSIRPSLFRALFFFNDGRAREYAIRGTDGQIATYVTASACSLLTNSANRVALGARIHKEAWRWSYELNGRSASDLSGSSGCAVLGGFRAIFVLILITLGLLWRPIWARSGGRSRFE